MVDITDLFVKLGRLARCQYLLNSGQAALPAAFTSLHTEFNGDYASIDGAVASAEAGGVRAMASLGGSLQAAAQQLVLAAVRADAPAAAQSLPAALTELRRQMIAGSESVAAPAVGASASALAGMIGTGAVVLTTVNGEGFARQHLIAEVARLACVADSYTGGATAGRERFQFTGRPNSAGRNDYDWPQGSGASSSFSAVSADENGSSGGNLLTNGDFEDWTADAAPHLSGWTTSQTWGTDLQRTTSANRGSYALELIAGTGTNTAVYQQFGTDTAPVPAALTAYAVNLWAKRSGVVSAGVLTVELVDGTGTVVNDSQGVANSFTVTLSGLTTSFVAHNGVFRLPAAPPSTLRVRLRLSTALAGANVLIDDVCLTKVASPYDGGPGVAVFSGATPFQAGDAWEITTTNDRAGELYLACWQSTFLRWFSNPLYLLPTSGSPTQASSLITAP